MTSFGNMNLNPKDFIETAEKVGADVTKVLAAFSGTATALMTPTEVNFTHTGPVTTYNANAEYAKYGFTWLTEQEYTFKSMIRVPGKFATGEKKLEKADERTTLPSATREGLGMTGDTGTDILAVQNAWVEQKMNVLLQSSEYRTAKTTQDKMKKKDLAKWQKKHLGSKGPASDLYDKYSAEVLDTAIKLRGHITVTGVLKSGEKPPKGPYGTQIKSRGYTQGDLRKDVFLQETEKEQMTSLKKGTNVDLMLPFRVSYTVKVINEDDAADRLAELKCTLLEAYNKKMDEVNNRLDASWEDAKKRLLAAKTDKKAAQAELGKLQAQQAGMKKELALKVSTDRADVPTEVQKIDSQAANVTKIFTDAGYLQDKSIGDEIKAQGERLKKALENLDKTAARVASQVANIKVIDDFNMFEAGAYGGMEEVAGMATEGKVKAVVTPQGDKLIVHFAATGITNPHLPEGINITWGNSETGDVTFYPTGDALGDGSTIGQNFNKHKVMG